MSSNSNPSSPSPHQQHQPAQQQRGNNNEYDKAVKSTADDAILAKLSCVEKGYYDDPFISAMSRGASGLVNKATASSMRSCSTSISGSRQGQGPRSCRHPSSMMGNSASSGTEPIIRRGTHARVKAVDRAIDAFLSIPLSATCKNDGTTTANRNIVRQVVVLGAGRDTTYLRHRFGKGSTIHNGDGVRWYEVDHPSVIVQKAHSWLSSCIPEGCSYECDVNVDTGNSYAVTMTSQKGGTIGSSSDEQSNPKSRTTTTSNYHLIGHDLRSSPATLFETLTHPRHQYDRSMPTLFVLECVMMYLPEEASWDLLRHLADSPISPPPSSSGMPQDDDDSSSTSPFVAVVVYDPIPSNDRFGQRMIDNLQRAGITGRKDPGSSSDGDKRPQLSLERTRTLSDQLTKLTQSGFDVAVGCDMMNAYDHGILSMDDRRRAARCEMLDELEEFVLLMKHYCLLVGVSSKGRKGDENEKSCNKCVGFQLCSVGKDSLVGFQEGRCVVVHR
eukprot:CAMPEP_0172307094 /NCGR_PEP_ID=MMETSP1058-20130122/8021_1 /TAXON_ID=83371 /ORGANISM="Detonula confervacea, Strain CCMP 353" /LENGTH=499 /DNA_ID=CAMNT_0013019167 /DNA_START=12 /DNA_END=1511 /DNA_ORIENTATION=-